jgi:hypothetical protein
MTLSLVVIMTELTGSPTYILPCTVVTLLARWAVEAFDLPTLYDYTLHRRADVPLVLSVEDGMTTDGATVGQRASTCTDVIMYCARRRLASRIECDQTAKTARALLLQRKVAENASAASSSAGHLQHLYEKLHDLTAVVADLRLYEAQLWAKYAHKLTCTETMATNTCDDDRLLVLWDGMPLTHVLGMLEAAQIRADAAAMSARLDAAVRRVTLAEGGRPVAVVATSGGSGELHATTDKDDMTLSSPVATVAGVDAAVIADRRRRFLRTEATLSSPTAPQSDEFTPAVLEHWAQAADGADAALTALPALFPVLCAPPFTEHCAALGDDSRVGHDDGRTLPSDSATTASTVVATGDGAAGSPSVAPSTVVVPSSFHVLLGTAMRGDLVAAINVLAAAHPPLSLSAARVYFSSSGPTGGGTGMFVAGTPCAGTSGAGPGTVGSPNGSGRNQWSSVLAPCQLVVTGSMRAVALLRSMQELGVRSVVVTQNASVAHVITRKDVVSFLRTVES